MSIVAEAWPYVIGVDTHAKHHSYAIVATGTGVVMAERSFPVTTAGMRRAMSWMRNRTGGDAFAVSAEGTGSYGRTLTRMLETEQVPVLETRAPARTSRVRDGKTDRFDAVAAAKGILATDLHRVAKPRTGGVHDALQTLLTARDSMNSDRTSARNQLIAILRRHDLGIDARTSPGVGIVRQIAAWRARRGDDLATAIVRAEAKRLAARTLQLDTELAANHEQLEMVIHSTAPSLLALPGVGVISAAQVLRAYAQPGRIHSADAFARLAGTAPVPVYSGNSGAMRLSRTGDRQLNAALHRIILTRLRCHNDTRTYVERRISEGKPKRAIIRILKRYLARTLYRHLNTTMHT